MKRIHRSLVLVPALLAAFAFTSVPASAARHLPSPVRHQTVQLSGFLAGVSAYVEGLVGHIADFRRRL